jgi:hypothetical protein
MKSKIALPVVLFAIIAALAASLIYEVVQRKRAEAQRQALEDQVKGDARMFIALGLKFYEGLAQGDVEAVKQRLGGDLAANALLYEQKYGGDTGSGFASSLAEAKAIGEKIYPMNN